MFRPETARPLNDLVQTLLHNPHPTLSPGERELIATYVSGLNTCKYCCSIHGAIAQHHLDNNAELVKQVVANPDTAPISDKMKALLKVAAKVQKGGKNVTAEDVANAREKGATDIEIHDTVLIAALFCLYNRYVDGLATITPSHPEFYQGLGKRLKDHGYNRLPQGYDHLKKNTPVVQ